MDTREHYPYRFAKHDSVTVARTKLPAGDYAVRRGDDVLAAVERKSMPDLAKALVDGSLAFKMAELGSVPAAAVVVEGRYPDLFKVERVRPGWLPEVLARLQVRYPDVPVVFADTRPFAEEWTYRFLGAALRELGTDEHP